MDFSEAYEFLFRYVNYETQPTGTYDPQLFSLSRIRRLLSSLGDPHQRYPSVHIAGTKGKGSVAAMVESVLSAAGHRAGLYTSPHLCDLRERFQIERTNISKADFASVMSDMRPHVEELTGVTFFEIATALALEWFARHNVSVAVLEVGLGGRLDATNVVSPAICAITSISFDHVSLLGKTLGEIAAEKGGIIKTGVPVVCAPQKPAALARLEEIASEHHAPFRLVGRDWSVVRCPPHQQGETFSLSPASMPNHQEEYTLPLLGSHQVENAAVSVALIEELRTRGWRVETGAISRGLQQVQWPARCHLVPGDPPLLIDCAHNMASAKTLASLLDERFGGVSPVIIFGAMQDKDIDGMMTELMPKARLAIMTRADHPRAIMPQDLAARLMRSGECGGPVAVASDLEQALLQARRDAPSLVLVTGSVALAGEALRAI